MLLNLILITLISLLSLANAAMIKTYAPIYKITSDPPPDFSQLAAGSRTRLGYVNLICANSTLVFDNDIAVSTQVQFFKDLNKTLDVVLVFGGPQGVVNEAAGCISDISQLVKLYKNVITVFGANQIEFHYGKELLDDVSGVKRRTVAIKYLKEQIPGLKVGVSLLLDGAKGLSANSMRVLDLAKSVNLEYDVVDLQDVGFGKVDEFTHSVNRTAVQIMKKNITSLIGLTLNITADEPEIAKNDSTKICEFARFTQSISYAGIDGLKKDSEDGFAISEQFGFFNRNCVHFRLTAGQTACNGIDKLTCDVGGNMVKSGYC